jgi:hypothetical protein
MSTKKWDFRPFRYRYQREEGKQESYLDVIYSINQHFGKDAK